MPVALAQRQPAYNMYCVEGEALKRGQPAMLSNDGVANVAGSQQITCEQRLSYINDVVNYLVTVIVVCRELCDVFMRRA